MKPVLSLFFRAAPWAGAFAAILSTSPAQPVGVELPAPARGAAAVAALGAHLPTVAQAYGLNRDALVALLESQPSLGVDRHGALMFACEGLAVAPGAKVGEAVTPNTSTMQLATGGTVDAFKLHSLPGASRVIYLDFDGHTTSGTQWNTSFNSGNPIVSAPFDLDGSPSTFNATERAVIQGIWKRVAEDYAPFAIDVTTEDPGIEALRKTTSTDTAYGVRVVISPTNWYGSAGGVGYVGSFSASTDTPCFAFTEQLANGEKYIAEAAAHEAGHTLGLYHDGLKATSTTAATEYYSGQGSWAPIMGVGYYQPLTQFSKGEYANANNTQDDFAVIATYAPFAADDVGGTLATARVLTGPALSDGGTIERASDVDVFRFDTGAGAVSIAVKSPAPETDLHVKAELLDAGGVTVATNGATQLDANFNVTLAAGTYYLRLSAVGEGDPLTTGYSSYGSVGNYIISGTLPTVTVAKQSPVAVASASATSGPAPLAVAFTGQNSSDADGTIVSYAWNFGDGTSSTAVNPAHTYSSAGTFTATLTVTDNDGLQGSASVVITVIAPTATNQSPVAVASSDVQSGPAPLAVVFSATGSYDPDGSLVSYAWDFGDGTSANAATYSKTFSAAGTYAVRLTVTDNLGATGTSQLTVTVTAPVTVDHNGDVDVQQYALSTSTAPSGTTAVATIVVADRLGRLVSNATVTVQWSGLVSGTSSGRTDAAGQVTLVSPKTKRSGTITGTITAVSVATGVYDSAIYSEPVTRTVSR